MSDDNLDNPGQTAFAVVPQDWKPDDSPPPPKKGRPKKPPGAPPQPYTKPERLNAADIARLRAELEYWKSMVPKFTREKFPF